MPKKISELEIVNQIVKGVQTEVYSRAVPPFIPSGIQDWDIIKVVGDNVRKGQTTIVNIQCNNKQGKTACAAVILRNILWENDPTYFDYPCFKEWPFTHDEYDKNGNTIKSGLCVKRFRIIGTMENTSDTGPIKTEIKHWWPAARFTAQKAGKTYMSQYETDTGWFGDVMTFNQEPKEFEGPLVSLTWIDEPARGELIGAITSRHSKGGLILITQTPIGAGPMLDILDDLKEKGAVVINSYSNIHENSVKTGKLNQKGTKRGLMTDDEITNFEAGTPENERPARLWGKNIGKSGKIYPQYNEIVHVKDVELDSPETKMWNAYMSFDPHDKYYPFAEWWAITPPMNGKSDYICYNEWPTVNTLAGYYDEKRNSVECHLTPQQMSQIFKIMDGTEFGISIAGRIIDPLFERNKRSEYTRKTDGIRLEYQKWDILFELPKIERIEAQRSHIMELLRYDNQMPVNALNRPRIYICPWCRNVRRSFSRHYWVPDEKNIGLEKESEQYKDPIDCARMFFAFIINRPYKIPTQKNEKAQVFKGDDFQEYLSGLRDIRLG
jgi:hypothetical protein